MLNLKNKGEYKMKNIMKMMCLLVLLPLSAKAAVHDLKAQGYTGRYCVGSTLSYNLDGEYVENVLISAEGIRNDGFIKVYADGELVQNIGVPGYDPDYSFRVRRSVENITLKFERTCSRILDMKIFTKNENRRRANHTSFDSSDLNLGMNLLQIVEELSQSLIFRSDYSGNVWKKYLLPLKKLGLAHGTRDAVRDGRSLETAYYALRIALKIMNSEKFLYTLMADRKLEPLVYELFEMKQIILELYDVKEKNIYREISELESVIQL